MPARTPRTDPAIRERNFHAWLVSHLPAGHRGILPLGDDAAALRPPAGTVAVLTTDSLVEGTHFLPGSPPARIGSAAVAVSLSDLAAKGARPAAVLLAVIVPPGTPRAWVQALALGAERAAVRYGASVVGGDTKPGPVRTVVSSALGWGRPRHLAPRSGAREGDLLVTTGVVGRGGVAAAELPTRRLPTPRALASLLDVRPRVLEGQVLVRWAHAMLDTSDGLAEATRLLAASSRVRVVVDEPRLPMAPGLRRLARSPVGRRTLAFFGGDYELLATLRPADLRAARRAVHAVGGRLTRIGRVERGSGAWLATAAGLLPMPNPGWVPFESDVPRGPSSRSARSPAVGA
jgi:thiamine-monophosphate kinase